MSDTFEAGDVVRLRSGGADMTVKAVTGYMVSCVWHATDFGLCSQEYPFVVLEKIATKK
jgi:uncharacterized protein YodC (DUF2158 family)